MRERLLLSAVPSAAGGASLLGERHDAVRASAINSVDRPSADGRTIRMAVSRLPNLGAHPCGGDREWFL